MDSDGDSDDDRDFRLLQWQGMSDMFMTFFVVTMTLIPILWYISIPKEPFEIEPNPAEAHGIKLAEIRLPVNRLRDALNTRPLSENELGPRVILGLNESVDGAIARIEELEDKVAKYEVPVVQEDVKSEPKTISDLEEELRRLEDLLARGQGSLDIREDDAKQFRFPSNQATISPEWLASLQQTQFTAASKEVLRLGPESAVRYSTLLIVGHTDGQPVNQQPVVDEVLYGVLTGRVPVSALTPGSNFDLGMMRAQAVAQAWRQFVETQPPEHREELEGVNVRCLSAGATMPADESVLKRREDFEGKKDASRRVEMKLILQKL